MKENNEKNRMKELLKSFKNSKENWIDKKDSQNEEKINEDFKKMKKNLFREKTNSFFQENYLSTAAWSKTNGKMVSDIGKGEAIGDTEIPGVSSWSLTSDEAGEVALKRTLESGSPINDMDFYDEFNRYMMRLRQNPLNPIDIKNLILKKIKS